MTTLRVNGKTRHSGDVFMVTENEEHRFYVISYNEENDELTLERVEPQTVRLLAPEKYRAAMEEIYPLRRVG